jgi:hypothetical protein
MIPERAYYRGQSYKLYDDYNDIHIFVEDAGFENLYKELFKKYGVKVENIFSKNGKESVLKAAESCEDPKCVFVVDRDWDDLLGIMPTLKNVVVLSMHSIECYLIDHIAFSGIVLGESPKCDIDSLLNEKNFAVILTDVSDKLRPLFECFAAMQMSDEKVKGCSYKPGHFQQKNRACTPDVRKIAQFISDSGVSVPQSVKNYFSDKVLNKKGHGKFMLHYVWEGVRNRVNVGRIKIERLIMRLAQLIDTQELKALANEVKAKVFSSQKNVPGV